MKDFIVTDENVEFVKACAISPDEMNVYTIEQSITFILPFKSLFRLICEWFVYGSGKIYVKSVLYAQNDVGATHSDGMTATIGRKG